MQLANQDQAPSSSHLTRSRFGSKLAQMLPLGTGRPDGFQLVYIECNQPSEMVKFGYMRDDAKQVAKFSWKL